VAPASPIIGSAGSASALGASELEASPSDDDASSIAEVASFVGAAASCPGARAEASGPGLLASAGWLLVGVPGVLAHRVEGVANAATIMREAE